MSALHVAHFPWDPTPPAQVQNPPTVPSNVPKTEPSPTPSGAALPPQPAQNNYGSAHIKLESEYESPVASYPQSNGYTSGLDGNRAQQRAQHFVQQRFGQQAHAAIASQNINQHAGGITLPNQQQRLGMPIPGQGQQVQRPTQPLAQRQSNIYNAQTDGSGDYLDDWNTVVAAKNAEGNDGPNGRLAADRMMRAQVEQMAQRLDSGLMVPLDELPKGKKRKAAICNRGQPSSVSGAGPSHMSQIPQLDGELSLEEDEEKKEKDEDAINSDLDDPDDDLDNGDDENDDTMDYMLCTYDKVQRVKNKWKCTLKDGILTTNKRE